MQIDFLDKTDSISEEQKNLLERLLQFAAKKEKVAEDAEISLTFVHNEEIQQLNREYRDKDAPTDVISFPMQEKTEGEMDIIGEMLPPVLGDIIISVDKAKEQAADYNHSMERELGFLTVHGFLHLLGYDHMNEEDEKKMFRKQESILGEFGLER
ncbi:endoribonuclease YbeY [Compostibacillus humi]|uniref:Endoribonuclease YbeY n=1 Tax=Compostibacillus humi TaxID=1245525 RepID=A0A8J2TMH3_9BACI|nr:rRNA maturation RNase YbeY [Compostibacillus humi]GFZ81915.1 endoribonuclease YbeY [Compostibacillus humi]